MNNLDTILVTPSDVQTVTELADFELALFGGGNADISLN
jgi:hypothetical protein